MSRFLRNNRISLLVVALFVIVCGIIIYKLLDILSQNGYKIYDYPLDMAVTGQFGDFVGGVLGTIISLGAFGFLSFSFYDQKEQYRKDKFESNFFELVKIHRDNVNEIEYSKVNFNGREDNYDNRKFFRLIFSDFVECKRELLKFMKTVDVELIVPSYKQKLEKYRKSQNANFDLYEMAINDIAYSIIYYGIEEEGSAILKKRFGPRYEANTFNRIIDFFKFKPQESNRSSFERWEEILDYKSGDLKSLIDIAQAVRRKDTDINSVDLRYRYLFIYNLNETKYYGGHQHRLGHYFRHLYQSFDYLSTDKTLSEEEKYFYSRTLRGQLSTYEQAILFVNSISSLGLKWEISAPREHNLITKYKIIKNLPSGGYFNLNQYQYYPKIVFEVDEE